MVTILAFQLIFFLNTKSSTVNDTPIAETIYTEISHQLTVSIWPILSYYLTITTDMRRQTRVVRFGSSNGYRSYRNTAH